MRKYDDSLPLKLLKAREAAMSYFRPMLLEYSITEQQWRVLRALNDVEELETRQLADTCCILSPSLTGIIQRLEQQDYVKRRKSSEDHRRILVSATPKARDLMEKISPLVDASYRQLTQELSREKMLQLGKLLDEVSLLKSKPAG